VRLLDMQPVSVLRSTPKGRGGAMRFSIHHQTDRVRGGQSFASSMLLVCIAMVAVLFPAVPAYAHGTCTPESDTSKVALDTHSYIATWDTWIVSGSHQARSATRFFCDGGEQHAHVRVEVWQFKCASHTPMYCDQGSKPVLIDMKSNDCYVSSDCQTIITTSCSANTLYWAKGRFMAYNTSNQLVHSNTHYPNKYIETSDGQHALSACA